MRIYLPVLFLCTSLFQNLSGEDKIINLNHLDKFLKQKGEVISMEGGDIMMFHEDFVLIGCSERTNSYTIEQVKTELFKRNLVKNVVQINIPAERSFMHIDTLFTTIDKNNIVCYKPIIFDGISSNVKVFRHDGTEAVYDSVRSFILKEVNPNMEFIFSGNGESPYQEREQWTDGCNLVTIKPGVALTYDRNPLTEIALQNQGYTIIHARKLLLDIESGKINPDDIQKP